MKVRITRNPNAKLLAVLHESDPPQDGKSKFVEGNSVHVTDEIGELLLQHHVAEMEVMHGVSGKPSIADAKAVDEKPLEQAKPEGKK